ncbi:MAG: hypothetical protein RJA12_575 [Planctomycetota bacterium]
MHILHHLAAAVPLALAASTDAPEAASWVDPLLQQLVTGLSNGMIIALIAIGYTMVYGIIELINFAHGDLCTLGAFLALTIAGALGVEAWGGLGGASGVVILLLASAVFCAGLNWTIDYVVYRPLRNAPKLTLLVSAIGCSFILVNVALFWGGLPMGVFGGGVAAAAPKDFPGLVSDDNLLPAAWHVTFTSSDLLVVCVTLPLMVALTVLVRYTKLGKAMRAVAQNPTAASLMGIDVDP